MPDAPRPDASLPDAPPPDAPLPDAAALWAEAACGLLVTSVDGEILRVNQTFCRWVGRDADALVGRVKLHELLSVGSRIFYQTHWAPLLQMQGSVAEVKLEMVHADGGRWPVVVNAVRRPHAGRVLHEMALFLAMDRHMYERELLLERQRAEALLEKEREAQRALTVAQAERDRERALAEDRALFAEQMIGIVSHDLRNPLAVIRMSAYLLGRAALSTPQQDALGRLTKSVARANRLIVDLLDFTQARLGRGLKVNLSKVDLHALVGECVGDLRLAHPDRTMEHCTEGHGPCVVGSDRIVQMVGNLVSNALAYGAPDGPVTVTSTIGDDTIAIAVHNLGEPIAAEALPRLFEPMTRGSGVGSLKLGVGLGLFIVREIAHAHQGEVEVESSIELGTTFRATLPRRTEVPPEADE